MESETLPLRPLSVSELLDAATSVLRRSPVRLLGAGLVLAAAEQAALRPLRSAMLDGPHDYTSVFHGRLGEMWKLIAVGMGTEAVAIALLGALAAAPALDLLLGPASRGIRLRSRPAATLALSVFVGVGASLSCWAFGVPWIVWFMFTGLVTPTLIIDAFTMPRTRGAAAERVGAMAALGRAFALTGRAKLRPAWVRLLGYIGWLAIRILLGSVGVTVLVRTIGVESTTWSTAIEYAVWIAVNALAYASLACLDAANQLDARMRVEGLDIALSRTIRHRSEPSTALAVPR